MGVDQTAGLRVLVVDDNVPEHCVGDAQRRSQILINYVHHAIKFTHQGEVVVRLRAVQQDGHHLLLRGEVQDTGIGMTAQQMEGLFEPFRQADSSITRRFGGTGLGLSISARLIGLMGGELKVNSTVGEGAVFW